VLGMTGSSLSWILAIADRLPSPPQRPSPLGRSRGESTFFDRWCVYTVVGFHIYAAEGLLR
jgi:hypothetical protein